MRVGFKILLAVVIVCSFKNVLGQVPGFVGKKITASVGWMAFPAFHATYHNLEDKTPTRKVSYYGINWIKSAIHYG